MTRSVPVGELRRFGDRAFLIGMDDAPRARVFAAALRRALTGAHVVAGAVEVVVGTTTVLVALADDDLDLRPVRDLVDQVHAATGRSAESTGEVDVGGVGVDGGRLVTIPCAFDGPDLGAVATHARCSVDEVVSLLTEGPLSVGVVGFSPGFAYLDGLPAPLTRVPRRDHPRPAVPAGSVALANGRAAVYPTASPGGWQLVGRTGFPLFSAAHAPYALLSPGDRVRFTRAGPADALEPSPVPPLPWTPPDRARLVFEVRSPGLRIVVQDAGRRDVAAAGVPYAGPADPISFSLANALLRNRVGAGTLEVTGGGVRLRCLGACHVGVVGASPELRVDKVPVPSAQVFPLAEGQLLAIGPLRQGCRTYVSVAGGILGPVLFGACATDELTGLGAGSLGAGDRVYADQWAPPLGDHLRAGTPTELGNGREVVELRVVPGPHAEQFVPDALRRLADPDFTVQPDSNRVGIRLLAASGALDLGAPGASSAALDSHGVVTGAVQVPPAGQPVVLLPDHATLGGYPVVAVVARADHGRLGQCGPGTRVRLVPLEEAEADEAFRTARRAQAGAVVGRYPLMAG